VKLCDVRDFEDPAFLATVRSVLPERDPEAHVERKVWEFAMLGLFLEEAGRLREDTEVLSVGAGDERILFWLANRVGRVVATDIYGEGRFEDDSAEPSMLENPAAHAPYPYPEERLDVRWMDGRDLRFPDASFDVVFSLSSIEHFGGPEDVARASREIGRVLRPGGHAVIVTDCLLRLHPLDRPPAETLLHVLTAGRKRRGSTLRRRSLLKDAFTPRELEQHIVGPSGLRLVQPLDLSVSEESWENVQLLARGALVSPTGRPYPHILVRTGRSVFTSVCLVLERPTTAR
jgi:SAM-dependent methyltransferase